ncbi:hypothetical protein BCR33DRAFT_344690 [Rhizoclosmatium globosum]|uniref:Uncharacterized protein n=1 Tax=Rhizoclosmatium globosum TaxID=329046 RepID=A0A1Y2C2S5_9FUNG|nr:hypothetical protein BCR33DRAFT_344690 [Rhizoclosmatium globosum]|eukprot:ORY41343.1 hypothetical protein BCR33DRAFT_344690 [Rhizoclosmatium globosum]
MLNTSFRFGESGGESGFGGEGGGTFVESAEYRSTTVKSGAGTRPLSAVRPKGTAYWLLSWLFVCLFVWLVKVVGWLVVGAHIVRIQRWVVRKDIECLALLEWDEALRHQQWICLWPMSTDCLDLEDAFAVESGSNHFVSSVVMHTANVKRVGR